MEKDANYFLVGIFVSVSLIALVGFSIWLAGKHDFANYERYTIYFTDPVNGLDDEATVKYKGVEVGKIEALRLTPKRTDLVKADIKVKEGTPMRAGTVAIIETQGITGQSYVDLATPSNDVNPPPRVEGEKYPVVKGTGSRLAKFLDSLPQLSARLDSTLASVKDLSREGGKTAESIRDFSREGSKTAESIRGLADTLKENPAQILSSSEHKGVEIPK